ncbi:MaoC/PaaZ C-terminal domain-containing protein [Thermodesulfobacteriota bacterium]
MAEQLYWEDVEEGTEVTPLPKVASTRMLVKWAGASGDFNALHFDDEFSRTQGESGRIVHGALKRQWLVQLVTDWMGEEGTLKKFSCQYRMTDRPRGMKSNTVPLDEGETWWCRGTVAKKYVEGDEHLVDCDIRLENGNADVTTPGKATVVLPSRG